MTEDVFSLSVAADGRTLKTVGTDADIILGKPGSPFGLLILIWADEQCCGISTKWNAKFWNNFCFGLCLCLNLINIFLLYLVVHT